MSLLNTLTLAMGTAWVSGINLYASVATLGLLGRFAHLQLPGELMALTSWWVIGVALALYLIEFIADKIPLIDSAWDVIHTFIRVPAGAVLAMAALGDFDTGIQAIAFLLGGGLALSSHGTKAATRAMINTTPEPVTNVVASVTEDFVAVSSVLLAVFYPVLLVVVVVVGLLISLFVLPRTIRYFRAVVGKMRGTADSERHP
ncbi:DUF4126 domain-containing protein [Geobacter sp.]|uniref:DUF4126 domain-containing protein n=1 Tax=Geobacter sp. TaxID=46610 RepID=UPI001AC206E1|nr:DUF4126 domain-containing protein [Geobacter sp.]CAG0976546.1 hypothetical protein GEOBC_01573 [Geobacteraceae bacterium]